jgi:hypothetical protein
VQSPQTDADDDEDPINDEDKSALRIFAEMQREKGLLDFKDEEYEIINYSKIIAAMAQMS